MSAQADRIVAELEVVKRAFDFDYHDLGEHLAEALAAATFEMMDAERDPDNNQWIELSEGYAEWKAKHYPGEPMSELDLVMKDPAQLKGELAIGRHHMRQTYGTTEEAKQEAVWFQEGNPPGQPPRPFWGIGDLALIYLGDVCDRRFAAFVP